MHVIVHEIGHALHLNHPGGDGVNPNFDKDDTVMSYNFAPELAHSSPIYFRDLDIHTLQDIWGVETNPQAPEWPATEKFPNVITQLPYSPPKVENQVAMIDNTQIDHDHDHDHEEIKLAEETLVVEDETNVVESAEETLVVEDETNVVESAEETLVVEDETNVVESAEETLAVEDETNVLESAEEILVVEDVNSVIDNVVNSINERKVERGYFKLAKKLQTRNGLNTSSGGLAMILSIKFYKFRRCNYWK